MCDEAHCAKREASVDIQLRLPMGTTTMKNILSFVLGAAFFATATWASPTYQVNSGGFNFLLSDELLAEFDQLECELSAIRPGGVMQWGGRLIRVKAITGAIDLAALGTDNPDDALLGYAGHRGGLRIDSCSNGAPTVELENLEIDFLEGSPVVTAIVIVDGDLYGRIELLVPAEAEYQWEPEYAPGKSGLYLFRKVPMKFAEEAAMLVPQLGLVVVEPVGEAWSRVILRKKPGVGEGNGRPEGNGPSNVPGKKPEEAIDQGDEPAA